jgi:hypothetical protein
LLVGGGSGYIFAKKQAEKEFEFRLAEEIEATKNFYARVHKKDEFSTPEGAVAALITTEELVEAVGPDMAAAAASAVKRYQGDVKKLGLEPKDDETSQADAEAVVNNIFEGPEVTDFGTVTRDSARPYVIPEEEFMLNEPEYNQVTVTYFVKDDTVADERDEAMTAINATIGVAHLQSFAGSPDTTFYVRNDALKVDFEITKSTGAFAEEVLGLRE